MIQHPTSLSHADSEMFSLIALIYDAIERPDLWPEVLDRFGAATGSGCTALISASGLASPADITAFARTDNGFVQKYAEHYALINPLTERCERLYADGEIRYSHEAIPEAEFERTEFYSDFFRPNGYHYSFGVKIPIEAQGFAYLTTLRSRHLGEFSQQDGANLSVLIPHLQRALSLHGRISRLQSSSAGLQAAFAAFDQAVVGLATDGSVLFMNRLASALIEGGRPLFLKENRLRLRAHKQDVKLQQMVRMVGDRSWGAVHRKPLALRAHAGDSSELRIVFLPFLSSAGGPGRNLASIVFISNPIQPSATRADLLEVLYKLSPTEIRIVEALCDGSPSAAIAMKMAVSSDTIRFHLKNIYSKTGLNRQVDLVRLVLSLPGGWPSHGVSRQWNTK